MSSFCRSFHYKKFQPCFLLRAVTCLCTQHFYTLAHYALASYINSYQHDETLSMQYKKI